MTAYSIIIKGKVQGVFFRASARKTASSLNLKGWVKNEPDRTVSLWVEGPDEKVEEFMDWCHRGPSQATVHEVMKKEEYPEDFKDFQILY